MLRALALGAALTLTLVGCGDKSASGPLDLSQPSFDLSMPGHACGASTCAGGCTGCVPFAGGLCVIPCNRAMPSTCPAGSCQPLVPSDGGAGAGVVLSGDCAAYDGYCG